MMRSTTGATAIALLLCSTTGGRAFTATAPIGSRGTFAGPAHHAPLNTSPACRLSNRGGRRSRKTTRATSLRMYVGAPTKADFYEVLGVSRDAGVAEIKRAYRNLAKRYHPDANIHKGRNTSEKFKEICEAYEVLSDDDARSKYDGDSAAARNHHAADGFDPFFRGFRGNHPGAGRGAAGSSRGGAGVGVGTGSGSSGRVASEAWKDFNGVGVGAAGRGAAGARATGSGAGSRRGTSAAWNGAGSGAAAAGASVRGPHASPMMGNDVRLDLEVDFETATAGGDQTVHVTHLETCATCDGDEAAPGTAVKTCRACNGDGGSVQVTRTHLGTIQSQQECQACGGSGRVVEEYCGMCSGQGRMAKTKAITVTIPPRVKNGSMLRVHGEGDCGPNGGPAGDLYIFITVKLDGNFRSEGSDVHSDVTIGYLDAILGSTVNVPLIGGEEVTIVIPPGTKPGTIMRLQGNGAPIRGDANNRGDHFVTINVDIPSELSREEEELLSRLKDLNLNGGSDNENTETSGLGGFFRNAFS